MLPGGRDYWRGRDRDDGADEELVRVVEFIRRLKREGVSAGGRTFMLNEIGLHTAETIARMLEEKQHRPTAQGEGS